MPLKIGVLAIQGAVEEHVKMIESTGAKAVEIRVPNEITDDLVGMILPGGESTTMAIVGEECGLFPVLKSWVQSNKPIWGTCAGMILLSNTAVMQCEGGQALIGGLDVEICRNYFGAQINSTAMDLHVSFLNATTTTTTTNNNNNNNNKRKRTNVIPSKNGSNNSNSSNSNSSNSDVCQAIFIRAPAILTTGKKVQVLATVKAKPHAMALEQVVSVLGPATATTANTNDTTTSSISSSHSKNKMNGNDKNEVISNNTSSTTTPITTNASSSNTKNDQWEVKVAVRQGNILATAFHPELTGDKRWHQYFLDICQTWGNDKGQRNSRTAMAAHHQQQ